MRGQGVNYRHTHTVQTTGNGVTTATEFTACVQHGKQFLNCGLVFSGVLIHRDTATVVYHAHTAVGQDGDFNVVTVTS